MPEAVGRMWSQIAQVILAELEQGSFHELIAFSLFHGKTIGLILMFSRPDI